MTHAAFRRRALVVVEDPIVRMETVAILEDVGFRSMQVSSLAHAMAAMDEHHPTLHLIFCDVEMTSERTGLSLARAAYMSYPHIKLILAASLAQASRYDIPEGAMLVYKPFSEPMVHALVQKLSPKRVQA